MPHDAKIYAQFYVGRPPALERRFRDIAIITIEQAHRELIKRPHDPLLYNQLGEAYMGLQRYGEARAAYGKMAKYSKGRLHTDALLFLSDVPRPRLSKVVRPR